MIRLIVGCGYLGLRVARRWISDGDTVIALTRSSKRARWLANQGISPLVGDAIQPASLPPFPPVDTLLMAIGFDRSSGRTIQEVYVDGLRNILTILPDTTKRIIFTSSTGVYGQIDGSEVDEQSVCQPTRAGGRACLEAENELVHGPWASRSVILRLAGIYGPNRLPRMHQLLAGDMLTTSAHGLLNLIHVDDAAQACQLAADAPLDLPQIFLAADGHPVARQTFYDKLAQLTGAPRPVFSETFATPAAAERASSSKRISNRQMIEQLGIALRYQDFRQGLAAIVRSAEVGQP